MSGRPEAVITTYHLTSPAMISSPSRTRRGGTYIVGTPSGEQEMILINESGFYSLLFRSRKPIAAQFKRWQTGF